MAEQYKHGDTVPKSGIYKVLHDKPHPEEHEVTCIAGKPFPPCRTCGKEVRFTLVRKAHHVSTHAHFK